MSDLREQIGAFTSELNEIREHDIAHDELDVANGFHDAQQAKEDSCSYLESVLERLKKHVNEMNDTIIAEKMTQIQQWTRNVKKHGEQIDNLANSGVHGPNFPKQRTSPLTVQWCCTSWLNPGSDTRSYPVILAKW